MRGAYRRQSARSASRRPAPPRAMAASSAASEASAFIGRERYHRPGTIASRPARGRPERSLTGRAAWTALSAAERIGQREDRPGPVALIRAAVHQAEHLRLGPGELGQERPDVRALDEVRDRVLHRQRGAERIRLVERT